MDATIQTTVDILNQKIIDYLKSCVGEYVDNYLPEEKKERLGRLLNDVYFSNDFTEHVTKNYIESPNFDIVNHLDINFITPELLSYMIEFIHNTKTIEGLYDDDDEIIDFSVVENVLKVYIVLWIGYEWDFEGEDNEEHDYEKWFIEYFDDDKPLYVLK
jgi:hypothetical protein